jgi:hypothetical protein
MLDALGLQHMREDTHRVVRLLCRESGTTGRSSRRAALSEVVDDERRLARLAAERQHVELNCEAAAPDHWAVNPPSMVML